jgi:hypothetical protein
MSELKFIFYKNSYKIVERSSTFSAIKLVLFSLCDMSQP